MPEDLRHADPSASHPVPRVLRLTVEYAGAHFAGWQFQPDARTVQGELEQALAVIERKPVRVQGASRTDAGVHALGQVASFETTTGVTCGRVLRGLNKLLPDDVVIREVVEAPAGFNARFSARGKHYRYRICDTKYRSPTALATAWHVPGPLDLEAMRAAAARFVGIHDFVALASKSISRYADEPTIRKVCEINLSRQPGVAWGDGSRCTAAGGATDEGCDERPIIAVDVVGTSFLYRMVRAIAGTLVQVGRGLRTPESVDTILSTRDRRTAGPAAPAEGLFLMRVLYEDAVDNAESSGSRADRTFDHTVEPSSSEGVPREGHDHRSAHERARHDQDVCRGEGREARSLLRSAP